MMITVIDREDAAHRIDIEAGTENNLMLMVADAGLPIRAECGGGCVCATCHVYIDEAPEGVLPPISEDEEDALDSAFDVRPTSRLACQIPVTDVSDGLKVTLAPDWP